MPTALVGRIRLYYECEGTGPPLLFISGLGADHHLWAPVVARLKDRYMCITFDNRGIGQSSRPRSGYAIPDLTRDTLGLLERLSISRAHILGMSMGGDGRSDHRRAPRGWPGRTRGTIPHHLPGARSR